MSLSASAPWLKYYGEVPHHLTYPQKTIYQMVRDAAIRDAKLPAYEFMGRRTSYRDFLARHDELARQRRAVQQSKRRRAAHIYHGSIILRYLLGRRVFGERMQGL